MDIRNLSNQDLITAESALDYRDPEIYAEIFRRAEEFEPGITAQYHESFSSCNLNSDDIFGRAVKYLLSV